MRPCFLVINFKSIYESKQLNTHIFTPTRLFHLTKKKKKRKANESTHIAHVRKRICTRIMGMYVHPCKLLLVFVYNDITNRFNVHIISVKLSAYPCAYMHAPAATEMFFSLSLSF